MTAETREKITKANIGKKAWNNGLTKETDERIKEYAEKKKGKPRLDMIGKPAWNSKGLKRNCIICNKEFKYPPHRKETVKYCSMKCYSEGKKGIKRPEHSKILRELYKIRVVWNKGKKCPQIASNRRSFKGFGNPRWLGGFSAFRGFGWKEISKNCMKRDNYKCRKCNNVKNLAVHHIIPYRITKDNSLSNLLTLCSRCHAKMENQYRRVGLTHYLKKDIEVNKALQRKLEIMETSEKAKKPYDEDTIVVPIESLKREAVKWIKQDEHEDIPLTKNRTTILAACNSKHRCEKCNWIKYFFNIKESDLE